jgi:hypothetical protein
MLSPDDFAARWTFSALARWSSETVDKLSLPANAKRFLKQAGLPTSTEIRGWRFGGEFLNLPRTSELPALAGRTADLPDVVLKSHAIGQDRSPVANLSPWFVVNHEANGEVWLIGTHTGVPTYAFVNSSLAQLAEALLSFHLLLRSHQNEPDELFAELLRRSLESCDPRALTESDGVWSGLTLEARWGM